MDVSVSNVEIFGINAAMRGMRNPMDSHWKSDTIDEKIGPNDLALAKRLLKSPEERKFLRFINVWFDLTLPRHTWVEFDTYKIGTTKNSCSTMNCLAIDRQSKSVHFFKQNDFYDDCVSQQILDELNALAISWFADKAERNNILLRMKNILPESYMLRATIVTNYEALLNMYRQRKSHRLETWHYFCYWIRTLPYMDEFITELETM